MEVEESLNTEKILLPWKWHPVKRRMLAGCELFAQGDEALCSVRKFIPFSDESSPDDDSLASDLTKKTFPCCVVGCSYVCSSLLSYENHYNSLHRHVCSSCRRVFPSELLLDIHIQENHDPLFTILATRQNMYRCLVESCTEKFKMPKERHDHMVKVHKYPANFRFHKDKNVGAKRKQEQKTDKGKPAMEVDSSPSQTVSLIQPKSTNKNNNSVVTDSINKNLGTTPSAEHITIRLEASSSMDLSGPAESVVETKPVRRVFVHNVPKNFSFGHGVSQGFQRPHGKKKKKGGHWHQRTEGLPEDTTVNIENVDMADMGQALEDTLS